MSALRRLILLIIPAVVLCYFNPPALAGINFVTSTSATANASSATIPIAISAGNTVVVTVAINNSRSQTVSTVTDSGGSGYSSLVSATNGTSVRYEIWGVVSARASSSVTVTLSGSTKFVIGVAEYTGVAGFGSVGSAAQTFNWWRVPVSNVLVGSWAVGGFAAQGTGTQSFLAPSVQSTSGTESFRTTAVTSGNATSSNVSGSLSDNTTVGVGGQVSIEIGASISTTENLAGAAAELRLAAPSISLISPTSGSISTAVTISGSNFAPTKSSSTVTFNGAAASYIGSWSDSQLLAYPSASATSGPVVVTVNGRASNSVNFTVSPTISSLSPNPAAVGTSVTINGANFGASQSSSTVALNGVAVTPSSWSATNIVVPIQAGAAAGPVIVTVGGQASNAMNLALGPSITGLAPVQGNSGTSVTITGYNFAATQGTSMVTFNGVAAAPISWSNTSIVVPVPAGVTTGPVVVTVASAPSNGVSFTVGTGTISGSVRNASNNSAINGATVQALQFGSVRGSAIADSNGTYTVPNLLPGTYDLKVSATGFGTAILPSNSVIAGGTTTVNASLSGAGTISGRVTRTDGVTAISGATVTAVQAGEPAASATADSNGQYSISTLSPGTYTLVAAASGFMSQTQSSGSVAAGGATTANFNLSAQPAITYYYDGVGRLVGASNSLSNTATYSYDSVGNLLSIANQPASQVSILAFDPPTGPVGTSVTINGTGFSSTVSLDTVKFNGTTATITAASATQLVATVPVSATNGAITVTAPAGSATSNSSFTVTSSAPTPPPPPTITGFGNPFWGPPETSVPIGGTNFDPTRTKDQVEFNGLRGTVTSATQTVLVATVPPSATSGYISVQTSGGKAVFTGYPFCVPPPPYSRSSIYSCYQLQLATNTIVVLPAGTGALPIELLFFFGTAGQRVSLNLSAAETTCCANVSLFSPTWASLASLSLASSAFIDTMTLPTDGTYTMVIAPNNGVWGAVTASPYSVPADFSATATVGGPSVTAMLPVPGQNGIVTFSGTAGQSVTVQLSGNSICTVNVSLLPPGGGNPLTSASSCNSTFSLPSQTLATSGTHTILFDPQAAATGKITVAVTSP